MLSVQLFYKLDIISNKHQPAQAPWPARLVLESWGCVWLPVSTVLAPQLDPGGGCPRSRWLTGSSLLALGLATPPR